MQIKASRRLKVLQERYANVLGQLVPAHINVRCTDGRSVREVIGLLLIDLDRLASGASFGRDRVPRYAAAFVDRRLAARWTERYEVGMIAAEAQRRFVKARAMAPDRMTPQYEHALARVAAHCQQLASAIPKLVAGA